jgi:hypothetical protein
MPYRSIYGRKVGVSGSHLLVNGRPIGSGLAVSPSQGKTWYVSSVINAGNGETIEGAAGTLQEVIDAIDTAETAGYEVEGSTINILPGHSETITGAGGLTFDVAGLRVIGHGIGSQRPTFLMDAGTTVTAVVTGANTYIENCVFKAGHSDIATCFDVDAAGFHLVNCEFQDNTTHENFLVGILSGSTTDNVCDGLTLIGNRFYTGTDSHTAFCQLVGDTDRVWVEGNLYQQGKPGGSAGSAGIFLDGTAGDDWGFITVKDNVINVHTTASDSYPLGGGNDQTDNTGIYVNNNLAGRWALGTTGAAGQQIYTKGTGFNFINNRVVQELTNPARVFPFPTDEAGWFQ